VPIADSDIKFEVLADSQNSKNFANQWIFIPTSNLNPKARKEAYRLNALGSSFYFAKFLLRRHRIVAHLHKKFIFDRLEASLIKKGIEFPRDHFKTDCSVSTAMWWALPFSERDEFLMRKLGYGDEWINWMKHIHDQNTRTAIVSEVIMNASKIGERIRLQYENNYLFRTIFPEIVPDSKCTWSSFTLTHKRTLDSSPQGEGTYDFLGVGTALQSRHYKRIIQDDLVGLEALNSEKVMNKTIEYHQLLVGGFDSDPTLAGKDNDELVIGNRWSYHDLNAYLRRDEPWFSFESHSALGGCCPYHPQGEILFPEEWNEEKLNVWHKRLKTYLFSCQFLNSPTLPGHTLFKEDWLNYYRFQTVSREDFRVQIVHEVKDGLVRKNLMPATLDSMILFVDPNHKEEEGRCNHALALIGWLQKLNRIYLLEAWADNTSYDSLVNQIYKYVEKWKLTEIYIEDNAAQRLLRYPLKAKGEILVRLGKIRRLPKFVFVPADRSKDAKRSRIEAMEGIFNGSDAEFFIRRTGHESFTTEYGQFPYGAKRDLLDALALAAQQINVGMSRDEVKDFMKKQLHNFQRRTARASHTGYAG
jgi:hypothetical protein